MNSNIPFWETAFPLGSLLTPNPAKPELAGKAFFPFIKDAFVWNYRALQRMPFESVFMVIDYRLVSWRWERAKDVNFERPVKNTILFYEGSKFIKMRQAGCDCILILSGGKVYASFLSGPNFNNPHNFFLRKS